MKQTFRSGIWLLAATVVVFGGLYPAEKAPDRKPLAGPILPSGIKAAISAGSPIDHGARQNDPSLLSHQEDAIETTRGMRIAASGKVKRFKGQGLTPRLISVSTPILMASSRVSFARAQCNDWENRIKTLDEAALQLFREFDQDQVERERKKARAMMFGLDCTNA